MTKKVLLIIFGVISQLIFAQKSSEKPPVFIACEGKSIQETEACFYSEIQKIVYKNFKIPNDVSADYSGNVTVLFEVTAQGVFKTLYVDANQKSLIDEAKRVFFSMPIVKPATFNGNPTYTKYTYKIVIPLQNPDDIKKEEIFEPKTNTNPEAKIKKDEVLTELDSLPYQKFKNPQYKSHLNIPFSHAFYAQFDEKMNQMGANNHTASKPFTYNEVNNYYDLAAANDKLLKKKESWWGRKIWNENAFTVQGESYWFTLNPIFDLQAGKSSPSKTSSTFVNTRGLQVRGGLGEKLNFTTTIYESQGRFADYFNDYANAIKPSGGNPATIPGIGIAKGFRTDAYDFPMAEANLTFVPSKFFNLQLGYGRNFIGDGYRSLFMTDGVSPYPYFKINTTFWKIKYTNLYMWMKDTRDAATIDGTYASKYVATHYLSWNVTNKFNLGFFESVVWTNTNNRGFDFNFVNPIIFYRAVEFSSSSKSGNALLGLTGKYKWNNQINFYSQLLIDEFSSGDVLGGEKSWKNKMALQFGAKYYNAFHVKNLLLQVEFNRMRPYVYSHKEVITNYGNNNQSLGHQWGGNAQELVLIARWYKGRYFANFKLNYGIKGFDFNTAEDTYNYGGNMYLSYEENRPRDKGVTIGQGNKTTISIAELQAGYLINPQTNMKLFGNILFRNFNPTTETDITKNSNTTWFTVGLRCDIFNWYFDY